MTIKTKLHYTRLAVLAVFITKYCMFGYLVAMLFFVYKFSPPAWYYYPLLVVLLIAIHKIQFNLVMMSVYYTTLNSKGEVNDVE